MAVPKQAQQKRQSINLARGENGDPKRSVSVSGMFKQRRSFTHNERKRKLPLTLAEDSPTAQGRIKTRKLHSDESAGTETTKPRAQFKSWASHPLATSFKETASTYRQTLLADSSTRLSALHRSLLKALRDQSASTAEKTLQSYQPYGLPLPEHPLSITMTDGKGRKLVKESTLDARMKGFAQVVSAECKRLAALDRELLLNTKAVMLLACEMIGERNAQEVWVQAGLVIAPEGVGDERDGQAKEGVSKARAELDDCLLSCLSETADAGKCAVDLMAKEDREVKKSREDMKKSLIEIMQSM